MKKGAKNSSFYRINILGGKHNSIYLLLYLFFFRLKIQRIDIYYAFYA